MYVMKRSTAGCLRKAFHAVARDLAGEALDATTAEVRLGLAVALVCEAGDDGSRLKWEVVGKEVWQKASALADHLRSRGEQASLRGLAKTHAELSKHRPSLLAAALVLLIEAVAYWKLSPEGERDLPLTSNPRVGLDDPCIARLAAEYRPQAQTLLGQARRLAQQKRLPSRREGAVVPAAAG
jgi:hypothetical protein